LKAVACGFNSTFALTPDGEVWATGFGPVLGLGTKENIAIPTKVDLGKAKAASIVAGQNHTAVLTEEGEVFVWGVNKQRQLGEACANEQLLPAKLELTSASGERLKAQRVVTGWYQTAVFAEDGRLYIFGDGEVGETAASSTRGVDTSTILAYQEEGGTIHDIAFGWKHAMLLGTPRTY